jgi:hypothetical protein
MRRALLILSLTLLALSAAAAQEPPRDGRGNKAGGGPIVVPFELLKTGHMAVEVRVNGKGPYRLIFDTGAPLNLVNNKLAKDVGLVKKDEKPGLMMGLGGVKTMDTLELGGAKVDKVRAMVADHPTVRAFDKAMGPIEGIVGFPFFAQYKTTVDYQKKEITLVPNGYVPADVTQALMERVMAGGGGKKPAPAVIAPAAVWGFVVGKDDADEAAGVTVKEVLDGGPAAAGGLKAGDRLLTLDGRWTDSVGDTFLAASLVRPGRAVAVVVIRDGKEVRLTVRPAAGV